MCNASVIQAIFLWFEHETRPFLNHFELARGELVKRKWCVICEISSSLGSKVLGEFWTRDRRNKKGEKTLIRSKRLSKIGHRADFSPTRPAALNTPILEPYTNYCASTVKQSVGTWVASPKLEMTKASARDNATKTKEGTCKIKNGRSN